MADELKQLRSRIDALDQEILKLVSERAAAAHAIGKLKGDGPVYRPNARPRCSGKSPGAIPGLCRTRR